MFKKLSNGVGINVIPTQKFKTISFTFDLISPVKEENFAKRAVLAQLLETSNSDYPSQSKLARHLSAMYGASFGTNILRYGNLSILRINLSIPNPRYVDGQDDLLKHAIEFLYSVVFKPLANDDHFDDKTFNLQLANMKKYVASIPDDKQYLGSIKLKEMYFKNCPSRGNFLFGKVSDYDELTSSNEYDYYQNCINNDNMIVSVIGDVDVNSIYELFGNFEITNRKDIYEIEPLRNNQSTKKVESVTQRITSSQSYLNLGYNLPVFFDDDNFMAAIIFNAVFGGTPQSKLFKNVREKNSLAYYANSIYNSINGFMMVSAGIDYKNKDKVIDIVNQELENISNGLIDLETLNNIKSEMINAKMAVLDSPRQSMEQSFVNSLLGRNSDYQQWVERVKAVSINDIANVAKKVQLNSVFFLDGRM